jgi:hypothetical protein
MQKKITVAVSSVIIFFAGWTFGQTTGGGNNGVRWKTLTAFEKSIYALGFSRGYEQGFEEAGAAAIVSIQSQRPLPVATSEQKKKFSELAAQARDHAFIGKATVGQITATVDAFYGDYRNMPVCWNVCGFDGAWPTCREKLRFQALTGAGCFVMRKYTPAGRLFS